MGRCVRNSEFGGQQAAKSHLPGPPLRKEGGIRVCSLFRCTYGTLWEREKPSAALGQEAAQKPTPEKRAAKGAPLPAEGERTGHAAFWEAPCTYQDPGPASASPSCRPRDKHTPHKIRQGLLSG